ncbi:glycosyltransferase family 2 protein [Spirulina subsalsa FACHB-351]|uniref:Glycosyltransferase family 2 protein n=1 Tax=Spirulina subsalsa FACHB-351 TaxID=234711 RepID=A0ABT3L271_9CYAN|nr:glycosyltransferase family 2 protein [Spirulina subsalsa]MCW6035584.1 glycosyltransferase family 2 protein [Spirulina subsalsa FACHB-351]
MPKVTVCVPTYNRQHFLSIAIASVLAQTYTDWELVVCDDGSTDGTPQMMAEYQDPRIRYIRHETNIGKSNNMRSGYEAATGEYFIKFDDDDRLTPDFLRQTSAILDQHPKVDFVGTDHWLIDEQNQRNPEATKANSQRWGRHQLPSGIVDNLLEVVFVQQSFQVGATLFRYSALKTVDFMRPNLQNCEDNDLFVRLALAGKVAYYLPELLMEYRFHGEQQGLQRDIRYLADKVAYLEYFQFDGESLEKNRRSRLAESQLMLGLRLIEAGHNSQGRNLIQQSSQYTRGSRKATLAILLSYLPLPLSRTLLNRWRKLRPADYAQQVRQTQNR